MESDCRNMTISMIYLYIALSDKIYVFQYAPTYKDIYFLRYVLCIPIYSNINIQGVFNWSALKSPTPLGNSDT